MVSLTEIRHIKKNSGVGQGIMEYIKKTMSSMLNILNLRNFGHPNKISSKQLDV